MTRHSKKSKNGRKTNQVLIRKQGEPKGDLSSPLGEEPDLEGSWQHQLGGAFRSCRKPHTRGQGLP